MTYGHVEGLHTDQSVGGFSIKKEGEDFVAYKDGTKNVQSS